jgi:predicted O-linked N-acetylglucosamine transferase (SPINDLY family)
LIGAPRVEPAEHIARFRLADLFLDTWPCNAHTTASDALWAAVPVVTLMGQTFASRVAASLINAVGTPELICQDLAQYEKTVIELAADAPRRAALRLHLERARVDSPLFDSLRFTRNIEALYLRMMMRHVDGVAPDHLAAGTAV